MEVLYGILSWGSPLGLALFFFFRVVVRVFYFGGYPISSKARSPSQQIARSPHPLGVGIGQRKEIRAHQIGQGA